MSIKNDESREQARSFRAAAIGSVVSYNTLGTTVISEYETEAIAIPKALASARRSWLSGLWGLREYLRRRRQKRREKRIRRLTQALLSTGIISAQSEILRKLALIEKSLSLLDARMIELPGASEILRKLALIEESLSLLDARMIELPGVKAAVETSVDQIGTELLSRTAIINDRVDALVNRNVIQLKDDRVAVRTPYGYVICPQEGYHLILYLSEGGVHEPGTCRVLEALIQPGDHVIDVGAQVGLLTLVMGRAVGSTGSVLALEASEILADCIRRTLSTNGLTEHCSIVQVAASDSSGNATFNLAERSAHSSLLPLDEEAREVQVRTSTLDDLVSRSRRIALVKVDVEGAELLVLRGMTRLVQDNPDIVMVVEFGPSHLVRAGDTVAHWLSSFRDCGFDCVFEIDEELSVCRPLRTEIELLRVHSLNLVFMRSTSSRIERIPRQ